MVFFDQMSPEQQLESVNKEIDRMNLMIRLSLESLVELEKTKKEVEKKLNIESTTEKSKYFRIDDVLRYLPEIKNRDKENFYKDIIEAALYYLKEHKELNENIIEYAKRI